MHEVVLGLVIGLAVGHLLNGSPRTALAGGILYAILYTCFTVEERLDAVAEERAAHCECAP